MDGFCRICVTMFCLILAASFLVCAYGAVLPPDHSIHGRIVGGTPADITEVPYIVSLLEDTYEIGNFSHICGGSIMSSTVIVTAAHCANGTTPKQWKIRAGSSTHNAGGQVINVARIVVNENFNGDHGPDHDHDHDIALLFLESELQFGPGVRTVDLAKQGQDVPDGSPAFVAGWGILSDGGVQPINLQKVTIPIVNQQVCIDAYKKYDNITDTMICAGLMGVGGQDACEMDSGGPLIVDGLLVGITSWGRGCAEADYPGVWTRVPALRSWVDEHSGIV